MWYTTRKKFRISLQEDKSSGLQYVRSTAWCYILQYRCVHFTRLFVERAWKWAEFSTRNDSYVRCVYVQSGRMPSCMAQTLVIDMYHEHDRGKLQQCSFMWLRAMEENGEEKKNSVCVYVCVCMLGMWLHNWSYVGVRMRRRWTIRNGHGLWFYSFMCQYIARMDCIKIGMVHAIVPQFYRHRKYSKLIICSQNRTQQQKIWFVSVNIL